MCNKNKIYLSIIGMLVLIDIALGIAPGYVVTDLGKGGAYAINDSGQVVGHFSNVTDKAYMWQDGVYTYLSSLPQGYTECRAYDINNSGQIVGRAGNRGVLWDQGTTTDLGNLRIGENDDNYAEARGINDSGQIIGWSHTTNIPHAFLWENGQIQDLGTLPGQPYSNAMAINNQGQIVGYSGTGSENHHAFLYSNTTGWQDLGVIGGPLSEALAINNNGLIAGWSTTTSNSDSTACTWTNGLPTDHGTLGGDWGNFYGLNDAGQIVGRKTIGGYSKPVLWENGVVYDLITRIQGSNPFSSSWFAYDINMEGEIVGCAWKDGEWHGFLLTPVPEPTTMGLLAVCGLALLRRKRK